LVCCVGGCRTIMPCSCIHLCPSATHLPPASWRGDPYICPSAQLRATCPRATSSDLTDRTQLVPLRRCRYHAALMLAGEAQVKTTCASAADLAMLIGSLSCRILVIFGLPKQCVSPDGQHRQWETDGGASAANTCKLLHLLSEAGIACVYA
jgi:hypothetical protein